MLENGEIIYIYLFILILFWLLTLEEFLIEKEILQTDFLPFPFWLCLMRPFSFFIFYFLVSPF